VTALVERVNANRGSAADATTVARVPTPLRARRPLLAVASALLVFVSIAGFADLYASANHHASVLVVTRTIEQGQQISADDLSAANIDVSGRVSPIPVSDSSELNGERAAVTIPAGSLLITNDLTDSPSIPAGDAVVGLALKAGEMPAAGVEPGDQVMIVETAPAGAALDGTGGTGGASQSSDVTGQESEGSGEPTGVLVPQADVFDVQIPPIDASSDTLQLVSVEVSSTEAAAVTTAANAGQVSLVLLPASSAAGGTSTGGN
jgi:Flp pilus assembly protein CpaB